MNAPFKTPTADLPLWDLSDLYTAKDDPGLKRDMEAARASVAEMNALAGTLVAARGEPAVLGERLDRAITLYEQAADRLGAVGAYAFLDASTRRDDAAAQAFEADVRQSLTEISTPTVWLTLEINQLEEAEVEAALSAHAPAAGWRPWLRRVRAMKPHELSEELETFLAEQMPVSAQWPRLFDETLADLRVKAGRDTLTLSEALNGLSDPKAARRKAVAEGLTGALKAETRTLGLVLNTVAAEKALEDRKRGFKRPADSRHLANEVDGEAVDAMVEAVTEAYPRLSHRYYAAKARALGVKTLNHWDRNAPLTTKPPRGFDWAQGRALVLDSFSDLGPEFAERAGAFFDRNWIDARPRAGKQSGAYAHPVTADRHPYVFLNWMGERRDVLTLAHELGHGVLATAPRSEQRGLLAGRIEDGLNTVVRQIAFHRFETRFHDERQRGEVGPDRIGAIWLEEMGASLGPAVTLNDGYEHWWAYVSHFVHSPFYVYAYAFGDLLVAALMETRRKDPAAFTPLYRELLAGGGTRPYDEALKPFGLNPRDPAFWDIGLVRLERLIEAFEGTLEA